MNEGFAMPLSLSLHPTDTPNMAIIRLPLPSQPYHPNTKPSVRFAVSVINTRARVVARAVFDHLGWQPGQSLHHELRGGLITITTAPTGHSRHTIAAPGHIRLPAELRHATGITPGDALLLAAVPEHQLALIYPPWTQYTLLQATLPSIEDMT